MISRVYEGEISWTTKDGRRVKRTVCFDSQFLAHEALKGFAKKLSREGCLIEEISIDRKPCLTSRTSKFLHP